MALFGVHLRSIPNGSQIARVIRTVEPDEIYNLAAQSHVAVSFGQPEYTGNVDGLGTTRLPESIRDSNIDTRFYQAGTSEMFGASPPSQNEDTSFHPRSPYAAAELYAHWIVANHREAYGMFAVNGILFNHESQRRGETFVIRKITRAVAAILAGRQEHLYLGNLDALRDWGYARDYIVAMWMMLQQDKPTDYVIGTGEAHSVRDFCEEAFGLVDLDWEDFVRIDKAYYRPTEVEHLHADPSRAARNLGWKATTTSRTRFLMVESDLKDRGMGLDLARSKAASGQALNES